MDSKTVKTAVRDTYAAIATSSSSCCGPKCGCGTDTGLAGTISMNDLYAGVDQSIRERPISASGAEPRLRLRISSPG